MQSCRDREPQEWRSWLHCTLHMRTTDSCTRKCCQRPKPQGRNDQYEMPPHGYTTVLGEDNRRNERETHRAANRDNFHNPSTQRGHVVEREAESDTEIRLSTLLTP